MLIQVTKREVPQMDNVSNAVERWIDLEGSPQARRMPCSGKPLKRMMDINRLTLDQNVSE